MSKAHTPGPWVANESVVGSYTGFDINGAGPANKKWIASVHSDHHITGSESPELAKKKEREIATAQANARLIAAAPELLAALIALFNAQGSCVELTPEAMTAAASAIFKATGA